MRSPTSWKGSCTTLTSSQSRANVEETLHFAVLTGVRPMTETRPLDEVDAAYNRMMSGDARYRMVLTTVK